VKHGLSESTAVGPSSRIAPRRDAARRPNSRDPGNGNHWPFAETRCDRQLIRIMNSMAFGIPVIASVDPKFDSAKAHISPRESAANEKRPCKR
jgi:hypothetical protein